MYTITVNSYGSIKTQANVIQQSRCIQPLVSVVLPVYNAQSFLEKTLDTLLKQTLPNIEIVCIDDGSTDESMNILKKYAESDSRITLISQPNAFAGVARNAGLSVAKGEYLIFLDADDDFSLDLLKNAFLKISTNKAEILLFRYKKLNLKTGELSEGGYNQKILSEKKLTSAIEIASDIFQVTCPMPWNKMFSRKFIKENNLLFQATHFANDILFSYLALSKASRIAVLNETLLTYNIFGEKSLSNSRDKKPLLFLEAFKALKSELNEVGSLIFFESSLQKIVKDSIIWTGEAVSNRNSFYRELIRLKTLEQFSLQNDLDIKQKIPPEHSIVISLTSYPARIPAIHHTIKSLLKQTVRADRVVLWLAKDQFDGYELPDTLLKLTNEGLEICWTKDIKSYKKLIPALKRFPTSLIATADDDIIYPENWLELLYKSYIKHPNCINCHRAMRIRVENNDVQPYKTWYRGRYIPRKGTYGVVSSETSIDFRNFHTSGSGALYPPGSLHSDVFNEKLFQELAPTEDDIWYWAMAINNNTPICVVDGNLGLMDANAESNQEFALYNINSKNDTTNKIFNNIFSYYPSIKEKVVNCHRVIVSLTSYPKRISTVHLTIKSLLKQSYEADLVILWLSPEEFCQQEKDLPLNLLELCKNERFKICWYKNIKSYKKLIPTLKEFPNDIVITADDDVVYPENFVSELMNSFNDFPMVISCHRCHRITFGNSGEINPYKKWLWSEKFSDKTITKLNFATGIGGVLYPPNILHKDVFNEECFTMLAPRGDDIWFWAMALMNGVSIRKVPNFIRKFQTIDGTQDECLWSQNIAQGNDAQLNHVLNYYPHLQVILNKANMDYKDEQLNALQKKLRELEKLRQVQPTVSSLIKLKIKGFVYSRTLLKRVYLFIKPLILKRRY